VTVHAAALVLGAATLACSRGDDHGRAERAVPMREAPMRGPRAPRLRGEPFVRGGPSGGDPASMCDMQSGPLTPSARAAALRALTDERRAQSDYAGVLADLGQAPPFTPIERAERRHAGAIERFLRAHGEDGADAAPPPPTRSFTGRAEACRAGAESERRNIAMYDELLEGDLPADERCVFEHLRAASLDHHLPAFERCAAR
jgi:hypothetical protein